MLRFAAFFVALSLAVFAASAAAQIIDPPPSNSTIPSLVPLVGHSGAVPDSALGRVTVTVRDLANNPVPNAHVVFDFSGMTDVRIAADPLDPRLLVNCLTRTVRAITGADGVASATIMGSSTGGVGSPTGSRVKIYADGVLLGAVPVAIYDLDGSGGVAIPDLSIWTADYFSVTNPARSDYDGNGIVSIPDLSRWGAAFFAGGSKASAVVCP